MKVIVLCGKAGVGKDTFGNELKIQLCKNGKPASCVAYADRLKDICTRYFGWDGIKDAAGRHLLQYFGTDVVRNCDPNFWVDEVARFLQVCEKAEVFEYVIITDARFPNEIERLRDVYKLDVLPFRIKRENFESRLSVEAQNHLSETALDHYIIPSIDLSGNLENLPKEVGDFINDWRI